MADDQELSPPFLRIVRGNPSAEEISALVAVLAAGSRARQAAVSQPAFAWSARSRFVRAPLRAGPGGWRASALAR